MTNPSAGACLVAVTAAVVTTVAVPSPAFACGGRCAVVAGPLFGTLLAAAAAVWIVARAATWFRSRLRTRAQQFDSNRRM